MYLVMIKVVMKAPFFNFTAPDISNFVKAPHQFFSFKYEYDIQWVANVLINLKKKIREPMEQRILPLQALLVFPTRTSSGIVLVDSKSTWQRHQMETFSTLLALCAGNSPVTGEFPSQSPVMRSFDVYIDLRLNKQFSKQSWVWWLETPLRSSWRHRNDMGLDNIQFIPLIIHSLCYVAS